MRVDEPSAGCVRCEELEREIEYVLKYLACEFAECPVEQVDWRVSWCYDGLPEDGTPVSCGDRTPSCWRRLLVARREKEGEGR